MLNLSLNGRTLEQVDSFKYLGSKVCKDGSVKGEVNHRLSEGAKVWGALGKVCKVRTVGLKAKKNMYESIVIPIVTYGAETWSMSVNERKRLDVMEMKCLRSMCGVSILDRVRNEEVREKVQLNEKLSERIDKRILRWFFSRCD